MLAFPNDGSLRVRILPPVWMVISLREHLLARVPAFRVPAWADSSNSGIELFVTGVSIECKYLAVGYGLSIPRSL